MAEQLNLDLPCVPALGRGDFMVAPSNAIAVAMIEDWEKWAGHKLVLSGPLGAGKTHLTHVWASASGATVINAQDLTEERVPALAKGHVAVEDVPTIAGQQAFETALFHLHNLVLAEGHSLMVTGVGPLKSWGIALPDLASRLGAAAAADLQPPDDTLLTAVLAKLFADRQITPKPDVISYLVRRMDRSFEAANRMVEAIDALSLSRKKPVTRALVSDVLDKLA
jgi:chromosomal replication initiation ATPase DnaA